MRHVLSAVSRPSSPQYKWGDFAFPGLSRTHGYKLKLVFPGNGKLYKATSRVF